MYSYYTHKDTNPSNNKWDNLREATPQENMRNQNRRITNSSGFKGVTYFPATRKWRARIKINYKQICLGLHDTPELAHQAYCEAAKKYFGEFARTK